MTDRPWYKRYPSDFLSGTVGMPLEEKGAYSVVLDLIYANERPIIDDDGWIAGACGCSVRKWRLLRASLIARGKISVSDGRISNSRADFELHSSLSERDKKAQSGAAGGKKRAENKAKASKSNNLAQAELKLARARSREEGEGEYTIAEAIEPGGSKPANDLDPKAVYWRELTEELVTLLEKPETACRKVLGRLLSTAHSESEIVRRAILDASYHQPADPVPWMISRIQNMQQRPRAGPNGHQPRPKTGQEEFFDAIKRVTGQ